MTPSLVSTAYDLLAERWLDGRFSQQDGILQHKRALAFLSPSARGWALGVGCGCNTRFNAQILERKLTLEGVDNSERMVALARAADSGVTIHLGDASRWSFPHKYQFISAWDSIWHVQLSEQRSLMLKLMSALDPGGVLLFTAGGLDAPSEHTDNAMGPDLYYATLGIPGLLAVIQEAGCVIRHFEYDKYPENHLCVVVQSAA